MVLRGGGSPKMIGLSFINHIGGAVNRIYISIFGLEQAIQANPSASQSKLKLAVTSPTPAQAVQALSASSRSPSKQWKFTPFMVSFILSSVATSLSIGQHSAGAFFLEAELLLRWLLLYPAVLSVNVFGSS